jgi:predicted transcriptional regulator
MAGSHQQVTTMHATIPALDGCRLCKKMLCLARAAAATHAAFDAVIANEQSTLLQQGSIWNIQ